MPLSATLSARLDAGALLSGFVGADGTGGALGGAATALRGIDVPVPTDAVTGIVQGTGAIGTGGIGASVSLVASSAAPLLARLPVAGDLVAPLTETIALLEQFDPTTLTAQLHALQTRLTGEFDPQAHGGALGALLHVAELLSTAPEGQALLRVVTALLERVGVRLPATGAALGDLPTALDGVARVLGGLMSLESVLAEAERLSDVAATRLDADAVSAEALAVRTCFAGPQSIAAYVAATDVGAPDAVADAVAAVQACGERLDALRVRLTDGMAFGEATLAYLDVAQVQREVDAALALVRSGDLTPVGRLVRAFLDRLGPLLQLDVSGSMAGGLDGALGMLEARIGDFADGIRRVDVAQFAAPLDTGIGALTAALGDIGAVIARITETVRGALAGVRDAVAALPFQQIGDAVRAVLAPITGALDAITALVADVQAALDTAARAATTALGTVEGVVDGFKAEIESLFAGAKAFIDGLHLEAVLGQIADRIRAFADALAQAQMQPYFDAAAGAIDTTADVIGALPFGLLPDSMKAEVDEAVRPIKETDAQSVAREIEDLLQIGEDGRFALRGDVEAAIADVQHTYDALLAAVAEHDPRVYLAQIDGALGDLAARIASIAPQLALEPVQEAIARVKAVVASLDLTRELQPIQAVFDQVLAAVDTYSPVQLITPIEQRLTAARTSLVDAIRLDTWATTLDDLAARATTLLDRVDPVQLEPRIREALDEALALLDRLPTVRLGSMLGSVVAALLGGSGRRIHPAAIEAVLDWLAQSGGTAALTARAEHVAANVQRTRVAIDGVDVAAIAADAIAGARALRAAIDALPASAGRDAIGAAAATIAPETFFGGLGANQARYRASLAASSTAAEALRRTGFSEVDASTQRLGDAAGAGAPLGGLARAILARLGITGVEGGIPGIVRRVLAVAPPARLAGLASPIFAAVRDRVQALVQAFVTPLQAAVARVQALVASLDLAPLRTGVQEIVDQVKADIRAVDPLVLLAAPLAAFDALRAQVVAFDPLRDLLAVLDALRDTAARVIGKLHTQELLATPLAIYDEILALLRAVDVGALLAPVLDALDGIAHQVDDGLDRTVAAFERLQAALPSGGGGSLGGASVGVDVGGALGVG